jgi:hypothetical protein
VLEHADAKDAAALLQGALAARFSDRSAARVLVRSVNSTSPPFSGVIFISTRAEQLTRFPIGAANACTTSMMPAAVAAWADCSNGSTGGSIATAGGSAATACVARVKVASSRNSASRRCRGGISA